MKKYRFVRHTHAPKKDGLPDKDRSPSSVGFAQIKALQQSLRKEGPKLDKVFHSGVVRTRTPAQIAFGPLGCPIEEMPILFNPADGTVERVVLDWAAEKHGGNYGYNTPRYLADPIVRLAMEKYVTEAVHHIRTATEAARTGENVEVAFVCHAVYIQLFCQKLLASDHKVETKGGRVDLIDLDLKEGDQLIVTIYSDGSVEEIEYIPLEETEEVKAAQRQMAEEAIERIRREEADRHVPDL